MGQVMTGFSMSLDGYIAGPNEDFSRLFKWYNSGDTDYYFPGGMKVTVSEASAALLRDTVSKIGAMVCGRRLFDLTKGWGGKHPVDVPMFVVTHHPETVPDEFKQAGSAFTFVTDGVASAIARAQAVAEDKWVSIDSADIVQQCLQAGLLDGIHIDLVPFILGDGVPLFKQMGIEPIELEQTNIVVTPDVTHITYRLVR